MFDLLTGFKYFRLLHSKPFGFHCSQGHLQHLKQLVHSSPIYLEIYLIFSYLLSISFNDLNWHFVKEGFILYFNALCLTEFCIRSIALYYSVEFTHSSRAVKITNAALVKVGLLVVIATEPFTASLFVFLGVVASADPYFG